MPRQLDDWLYAYEQFTRGTESPDSFHLWTGIATIAAAAQRKIYLEYGHNTVHSNFFLVLVGPSGGPRKSSAMNVGRRLLKRLDEYGIKIHMAPKKATSAALISRMSLIKDAPHQSITAFASELGTLLGANSTDITDILTDLWDCDPDFDKDTVSRGAEKITAPWINVIGATTPTWLGENLPKTAAEGGFVSRGLYVYAEDKPRRVARPIITDEQHEIGRLLVADLAEISRLEGPFQFSESGGTYFDEWYNDASNFRPKYGNRMETYYERKHIHVLKTAMALSLSSGDSLLLEPAQLSTAIDLVEDLERTMALSFQGVGKNPLSMEQQQIKNQIAKAGTFGLPYKVLIGSNIHRIKKPEIDEILSTLLIIGEIGRDDNGAYFVKEARTPSMK